MGSLADLGGGVRRGEGGKGVKVRGRERVVEGVRGRERVVEGERGRVLGRVREDGLKGEIGWVWVREGTGMEV